MDSAYHALFLTLNASDDPPRLVVLLAIVCAKYLFVLIPLHMVLVWLGGTREMRFVAIVGGFAMVSALVASGLIGFVLPTPRPFVIGLGHTLIEHRPSAAFPSNHAIVCFVWAAVLSIYGQIGLVWVAATIGLLVAWSRIYLGVHYPLDMVGAALLSAIAAVLTVRLTLRDGGRFIARIDGIAGRLMSPVRTAR